MRQKLFLRLLLCAMALTGAAWADAVVTDADRCGGGTFMLETPGGYALIDWTSGRLLGKGATIAGDIANTLGRKEVSLTSGEKLQIFINNYGLNFATATQLLNARCGRQPLAFP
jgi:hypothetical protein